MTDLSPRQQDVLRIIRKHIDHHGFAPSIRELAMAMNVSIHAADGHLKALVRKGAVQRAPGIARGITLPHATGNACQS